MTQEDVEAILGVPPGNYASAHVRDMISDPTVPVQAKCWMSEEGAIYVVFEEGIVAYASWHDVVVSHESLWQRLRRCLGIR
ncbi:MAG: hypothetical protein L0Y72_10025 [Gemmataceae bacterium]|nr:hypothetical protein [Gemmataceae bacterium]MCI0739370.1 hypothetical protein [Gemmataceae bacterium]